MTVLQLLTRLRDLGVAVHSEGGRLTVRAPRGTLTTELRDELVSTLWFMLGNADDAQEMAQEVFLRCWRAQASLPGIRDLRAWIFRVGLNAARDIQRSA